MSKKIPEKVHLVTAGGELYYASLDKDEAESYAAEKLDEAIYDILDEQGNDDPSENDIAMAALQAGFDGNNYNAVTVNLKNKTKDDEIELDNGDVFDVSEILEKLKENE